MKYLQHVEVKREEWKRIYLETAPQAKRDCFLCAAGIHDEAPQAKGKRTKKR